MKPFYVHSIFTMPTITNLVTGLLLFPVAIIYTVVLCLLPKRFVQKNVKNQIILITGGASGFGRLLATKFALHHEAIVVIWDVNKAGLAETVEIIKRGGGTCFSYVVDVSSGEQVYVAAAKVQAEVGRVDILINNAGIGRDTNFVDVEDEVVEYMFQVNVLAHFRTIKAFLPAMISAGSGHIVTMASAVGLFGSPRIPVYCATKYAAIGLHESLTKQLKVAYPDAKITTTVICPYLCRTPLLQHNGKDFKPWKSSLLLPIREPEPVVDDMMDAILSNENFLINCWGVRFMVLIKSIIPCFVSTRMKEFYNKI